MRKEENGRGKNIYYLLILITGVIICFLLGESGPIIMPDSEMFLNPSDHIKNSYMVYVAFLKICRNIFSIESYLYGIWILQSVLAIVIAIVVTEYIRKEYGLGYGMAYAIYCMMYLPYMYNLPENVVTHHILTEAIAIPFVELFFGLVLKYYNQKKSKYLLYAIGIGVLLVKTRSQMSFILVVIVVMMIGSIILNIYKRINRNWKIVLFSVLLLSVMISICMLLFIIPVLVKNNSWQQLTDAVLGRTLCTIEEEDRELFEKAEHIEAFDYVYEKIDQDKYRMTYFRENTWRANDIAYATNENSKAYYDWIEAFYSEYHPEIEPSELPQRMSDTSLTLISELFRSNRTGYIIMTLQLIPSSLVSSIFVQPDSLHALCYYITFVLFMGTLCGLLICYRRGVDKKFLVPMWFTLLIMFSNALFVNLLFYGQQRYVIYTFGLFYVSWVIMLKGIKDTKKYESINNYTGL